MTRHVLTLLPGTRCLVALLSIVAWLAGGCTGKSVDSRGDSDADSDADSDTDADVDSDTGAETPVDYTTAWGSGMIEVAAGTFLMGSGKGDPEGSWTDHEVTLTHDFWLAQAEVTQTQWAAFPEASNPAPSHGDPCPDCPVDGVSWVDAALYANALSSVEGLPLCFLEDGSDIAPEFVNSDLTPNPYTCAGYRLPTEAEWEYAARAGTDTRFSGSDLAADVAWYVENAGRRSHQGCTLLSNAWGFCDMSGNAEEWASDRWEDQYGGYGDGEPDTDPAGPAWGYNRVDRGGNWLDDEANVSVADRNASYSESDTRGYGLRLCRTITR